MRRFACVLSVLSIVALSAASGQAELLLLDTYNNANNSDSYGATGLYGLNQELNQTYRQSGTNANTSYVIGGAPSGGETQVYNSGFGQKLFLNNSTDNPVWVALDRNFTKDVKVSADVEPHVWDNSGLQWVELGVRGTDNSPNNRNLGAATDVGAVLKVLSTGAWSYFENGSAVTGLSGTVTAANVYNVEMDVIGNLLTAKIGTTTLFLDHVLSGGAVGSNNYVSVATGEGTGTLSMVDNLRIEGVPEPTSMVLLATGLLGLLAYAWRKRR